MSTHCIFCRTILNNEIKTDECSTYPSCNIPLFWLQCLGLFGKNTMGSISLLCNFYFDWKLSRFTKRFRYRQIAILHRYSMQFNIRRFSCWLDSCCKYGIRWWWYKTSYFTKRYVVIGWTVRKTLLFRFIQPSLWTRWISEGQAICYVFQSIKMFPTT